MASNERVSDCLEGKLKDVYSGININMIMRTYYFSKCHTL